MANTKISALPSWTGTAADLRWFVMNNSGETETFKFSGYTSPFKTGSVNNSATLIGYAGTNAGRAGVLAGGSSTSYSNTANSIVWGEQCWIGDDQQYPSAVFGRFCRSTGSGNLVAGNNSAAAGVYSVVVGEGNSCDTIWGSVFGRSCSIDGGSYMSIVAGNISSIQNSYAAAVFGEQNSINGSQHSAVLGGKLNTIPALSPYNAIVAGTLNTISSTTSGSTILGGSGNTISNSVNSAIIGGTGNTNSNKINTIMLGTSGRTAIDNHTTYVENLKVFNQIQEQFYDNGTINSGVGGYIIDWSKGSKQAITITGGTNYLYYLDNVITGRCVLKVINTGVGTITWVDNAPKTWKLPVTTPTNQPTFNATDIFVWESFDDQGLWLTTHSENLT